MDVFNNLSSSESLLVICSNETKSIFEPLIKKFVSSRISTIEAVKDSEANSIVNVVSSVPSDKLSAELLTDILKVLKPDGKLTIINIADLASVEFILKTTGFMNVVIVEKTIMAFKPKFAVGSAAKLNLKKPVAVWKLEDNDEDDLIDPDDLLDEDDLKKPDPASLKVCGTTGKRKACKDCSCGLAEELAAEAQSGKVVDTTDAPKSSCGSCYLGDAFRCASCPYLGMPAFKPGDKIQLTTTQLKSDI